MIIGRSGEGIEKIRADIVKECSRKKITLPKDFKLDIIEVASPEASAAIVAQMVMEGLEKRLPFRRVLKSTVEKAMMNRDVKGIRIAVSGRLGGADMARREEMRRGNVPLQTLRADVDFAKERANMTYGVIGIKVWIYRGMKFDGIEATPTPSRESRPARSSAPRTGGYRGGESRGERSPSTGRNFTSRTTNAN
jgi:small subunit ribosomal protein S3